MTSILNEEWRGVVALIWLVFGYLVLRLLERLIDPIFSDYFCIMWSVMGWLFPSFRMAISGMRNGNVISKVCSVLVLVAMAIPVILFIGVGIMFYFAQNH
jgi:hypothetical protein